MVGGAAAALGLGLGSGLVQAAPSDTSTYNVVGEPYAKAVAILKAQGVHTVFGGSVGSDVAQAQCIVKSEKMLSSAGMSSAGKIQLNLDCTAESQPQQPVTASVPSSSGASGTQSAARPTPGAPGVVTVIATPVG